MLSMLSLLSFAQQGPAFDTPSSLEPVYSHQYTFLQDPRYYFIDTSFNSLEKYHHFNNAFSDLFGYTELGNLGAALNPIVYESKRKFWSYSDLGAYETYFPDVSNIPYYQVRSPLTEANYWMGYNRGHSFRIHHTQNIKPNWNFLIRYKRLNALGQYNFNRNKQSSFLANTRYHSPGGSYQAKAYFLNSKLDIEENGGIRNDSLFEVTNPENKLNVEVNLPPLLSGGGHRRILRKQEVFLDQNYNLLDLLDAFKAMPVDTAAADSTEQLPSEEADSDNSLLAIGHSFRYTRTAKTYQGYFVGNGYYDDYFFSEEEYSDSVATRELENTLYLQTELGKQKNFMLKAGIRHLYVDYGGEGYGLSSNNFGVTGEGYGRISDRFYVTAAGDLLFLGPLAEAYNLEGKADLRFYKNLHAFGGLALSNRLPSFYRQLYRSNNYIWNNNFNPEAVQKLHYGVRWKQSSQISVTNSRHDGYIYYSANGSPVQATDPVNVFQVDVIQNFTLWNFLHQDNRVVYQQVLGDASETLPLPEIVTRNSLYFEFNLFKNALEVLAGAEVKYFTSYYSPSYSPAIGDFYVADEREIGNYPVADLFLNFKLRKAQIFVKYQHLNQGYSGFDFYAAPFYPFPDRSLRVGITWRFFN